MKLTFCLLIALGLAKKLDPNDHHDDHNDPHSAAMEEYGEVEEWFDMWEPEPDLLGASLELEEDIEEAEVEMLLEEQEDQKSEDSSDSEVEITKQRSYDHKRKFLEQRRELFNECDGQA